MKMSNKRDPFVSLENDFVAAGGFARASEELISAYLDCLIVDPPEFLLRDCFPLDWEWLPPQMLTREEIDFFVAQALETLARQNILLDLAPATPAAVIYREIRRRLDQGIDMARDEAGQVYLNFCGLLAEECTLRPWCPICKQVEGLDEELAPELAVPSAEKMDPEGRDKPCPYIRAGTSPAPTLG